MRGGSSVSRMTETARHDSTARAREVGFELKQRRDEAGLTGRELSRMLEWPHGKISFIENGRRLPSPPDVAAYVVSCGPPEPESYRRLLALAKEPDTEYWVRPHSPELPTELRSLIIQESLAKSIATYEPLVIPGLLQSEQYIRALFRFGSTRPADEIELRVQARLARQGLLHRRLPPECAFYLQERALRTTVGDALVMNEQLLHLVLAASERRCAIRVVPDSAGPFSALTGAFRVMDYAEHPPTAYTETLTSGTFLDQPQDIALYRDLLSRLDRAALSRGQSRAWLASLASAYDQVEAATPCPPAKHPG
jgi:hypothetical protein